MPQISITDTKKIEIATVSHGSVIGTYEKRADEIRIETEMDNTFLDVDEAEELGKWLINIVKEIRNS